MSMYNFVFFSIFCILVYALIIGDWRAAASSTLCLLLMCFLGDAARADEVVTHDKPAFLRLNTTGSQLVTCTPHPAVWKCLTRDGDTFIIRKTKQELKQ
jgi:hypothetical protein